MTNEKTEERLARVERSNRRLVLAVFSLGVLIAVLGVFSLVSQRSTAEPEQLKVQSLEVVNDKGDVVVHLGARTSGAGGLWLTDAGGTRVIKINQDDRGGLLTVLDSSGESVGTIGVNRDGNIAVEPRY